MNKAPSANLKRQGSLTSCGSTRSKESTKSSVGFSAQPRSAIRRMRSVATGTRQVEQARLHVSVLSMTCP